MFQWFPRHQKWNKKRNKIKYVRNKHVTWIECKCRVASSAERFFSWTLRFRWTQRERKNISYARINIEYSMQWKRNKLQTIWNIRHKYGMDIVTKTILLVCESHVECDMWMAKCVAVCGIPKTHHRMNIKLCDANRLSGAHWPNSFSSIHQWLALLPLICAANIWRTKSYRNGGARQCHRAVERPTKAKRESI